MELKTFQKKALSTLRTYLERTRVTENPATGYHEILQEYDPTRTPPPYRTIPGLPGVPNVCLRLPTGGGKTLLAAHTIAVAGESYLEKEFPVVLWLVPTNTIRKQTAEALKNTSHPYRKAIDAGFGGKVSVFDISEIEQIRPQDLTDRVAVVVCTIQTLRVKNTDGRRAYAHAEQFEPHFAKVPKNLDLEVENVNEGAIRITGTVGHLEVGHVNDDVTLVRVAGEVDANTVNGELKVDFAAAPAGDCRFGTVNGDIELAFPKGLGAELTFATLNGEVYTDFPFELGKLPTTSERSKSGGRNHHAMGGTTAATIGGGGIELVCKTVNGDITIRERS